MEVEVEMCVCAGEGGEVWSGRTNRGPRVDIDAGAYKATAYVEAMCNRHLSPSA